MKTKMTILMVLISQFGLASNLMAAASAVREDTSMYLVWVFLSMCALIVIVQLLPALFLGIGMVKSFSSGTKSLAKENALGKK
ncbi:MAG: hypothetical protein KAU27_01035 [Desulfuromonadales bacterium]|nr:hypothetical protein [Desulfuromonadales bacterium]